MIPIQIEPKHFEILKSILKKYDLEVYAFGSRAKKKARTLSDLDLLLKGQPEKRTVRKLIDDFEESDLPFKVDVVLWDEIDEKFKDHIRNDLILIDRI